MAWRDGCSASGRSATSYLLTQKLGRGKRDRGRENRTRPSPPPATPKKRVSDGALVGLLKGTWLVDVSLISLMEPDDPRVRPSGAPDPPRRRQPRSVVLGATSVITVLVGVWLFQAGQDPPTEPLATASIPATPTSDLTSTTASRPMLADTPWVLVFDDGLDGVIVLDPNDPAGSRGSISVVGQRPGDQPYRLELVANHLVVGWEEIYAVALNSAESDLLGEATIFVPAAELDRVWLIDYSGGRIGQGTLQAWQVSFTGELLTPQFTIETEGVPAIGVAAGLAIESESGILIWDIGKGEVVATLGSGASFVSDTTFGHGSALAWCSDPCDELHITEIPTMEDVVWAAPGQGARFTARAARFSGDGRYLAAPTEAGDIIVLDRDTGRSHVEFSLPPSERTLLEWAPSTYEIFASSLTANGLTTRIGYEMLDTGRPEIIDVSLSLGSNFVVVSEDEARSFLGQSTG